MPANIALSFLFGPGCDADVVPAGAPQNYLLSASLDGSIKVWGPAALPSVLNPMPESTFAGGEDEGQSGARRRVSPLYKAPGRVMEWTGVRMSLS